MNGKGSHSDTSSSDEETITNALREATDHDFLKESFFNATQPEVDGNAKNEKNTIKLKSLRRNLGENDKCDEFRVTPEFKKFVAKKLDGILDRTIQLKNADDRPNEKKTKDATDNFGIKLLATSAYFLTTNEEPDHINVRKRKKNMMEINETDDDLRRFQEAAVDSEFIISKTDTKAWTSKRKDPEFKYRKGKNGILVAQD